MASRRSYVPFYHCGGRLLLLTCVLALVFVVVAYAAVGVISLPAFVAVTSVVCLTGFHPNCTAFCIGNWGKELSPRLTLIAA